MRTLKRKKPQSRRVTERTRLRLFSRGMLSGRKSSLRLCASAAVFEFDYFTVERYARSPSFHERIWMPAAKSFEQSKTE